MHVNSLGPVAVFPLEIGLVQLHKALESPPATGWVPYAGDLAYIMPKGTTSLSGFKGAGGCSSKAKQLVSGGGPFLAQVSPTLVEDVLERLGYLEPSWALDDAVRVFCDVHLKTLSASCSGLEDMNPEAQKSALHEVFASQVLRHHWKTMRSDERVRKALHERRFLATVREPQEVVREAVKRYLRQQGLEVPETESYLSCVVRMLRYEDKNQPNLRK